MRPRFVISLFVVVALILAFLFWLRPVKLTITPKKEGAYITNTSVLKASRSVSIKDTSLTNSKAISKPNPPITHRMTLEELTKQFVESKNKPINFYGLVIDQNSNALSNVHIKSSIEQLRVADPVKFEMGIGSKEIPIERTTGTDGRFEIHGVSGDGFGVILTKDGYLSPPDARYGFGGGTSGSYENPVIFKMWKEGPKEPLIGGSHVFGIDSGKTYTLNLMTGKKIEGVAEGDLLVSITRPPDAKPRDKFAWSFSIEAIQGGFAESDPNDEFMYIAPESGYQPKIEMQFDPSNPAWTGVIRKQIFLTTRNGQIYGRATIEIDSIYNVHSAIQIDYTINPNGSRNLQP